MTKQAEAEVVLHATSTGGKTLAVQVDESAQVMQLFEKALERDGGGVEALGKLVELHDRVQRRRAELEFAGALVRFQEDVPAVARNRTAKIATSSGSGFEYDYADFENVVATVRPVLSLHGLSFTFDTEVDGNKLTCICHLRHMNGHSVSSRFTLPTESKSAMSEQQKVGAALTFAKRQSLIAVLGLSLTDPEAAADRRTDAISLDQLATLEALVAEVDLNRKKFDSHFGITKLAEMQSHQYPEAVRILEGLRKKAK